MLPLAAVIAGWLISGEPAASRPAVLAVSASGAPQSVHGTDGREHIEYDLLVTNSFSTEVAPTSLVVRGGGRTLLELSGDALANATQFLGGGGPTATIPASSTAAMHVDVVMPRAAGRTVPRRLANRISFALPPGTSAPIVGSTTVRAPVLRVPPPEPIEIAPPLRGAGWVSANACCDPLLEHRSFVFPSNGTFVTSEMFAVDYIRLSDGRFYEGDGTANTAWFGYGAPVRAAAAGKVVVAVGDREEIPPFGEPNPTVHAPSQFPGNNVVVRMRRGVFAHYAHLQPGSIPCRSEIACARGRGSVSSATAATPRGRICISRSPTGATRCPPTASRSRSTTFASRARRKTARSPGSSFCRASRASCAARTRSPSR